MENVAEVFVLFLCGVQLVLRSGVLTILDLDEVDFTPSLIEVFRSVLSGVGGTTGDWRCCWDAPSLPQLPPATPKNSGGRVMHRDLWSYLYAMKVITLVRECYVAWYRCGSFSLLSVGSGFSLPA